MPGDDTTDEKRSAPLPAAGEALGSVVHAVDAAVPRLGSAADGVAPDRSRLMPWLGVLLGAAALLLVPWVLYLGVSLPERQLAAHYDVAWAGFDGALFVALAATSYCVLRRSEWLSAIAGATAALLVTDAWFDVVTSPDVGERVQAVAMAVLVEIPLAVLCVWLCGHAGRLADRRLRILARRNPGATRPD